MRKIKIAEGNQTFKGENQKKKKDFSREYDTSGPSYKTFKFICAFEPNHLRHFISLN